MHYHVYAVQDWGGSMEQWVCEDKKLNHEQAKALAADMVEADRLWWPQEDLTPEEIDANHRRAEAKFGERLRELHSSIMTPGWDAIWIEPCDEPCVWNIRNRPTSKPYWQAAEYERDEALTQLGELINTRFAEQRALEREGRMRRLLAKDHECFKCSGCNQRMGCYKDTYWRYQQSIFAECNEELPQMHTIDYKFCQSCYAQVGTIRLEDNCLASRNVSRTTTAGILQIYHHWSLIMPTRVENFEAKEDEEKPKPQSRNAYDAWMNTRFPELAKEAEAKRAAAGSATEGNACDEDIPF